MRSQWIFVALVASLGCASLWPPRAAACSCIADAFSRMDPEDGATNVARNHAVVVMGYFDLDSFELTAPDGTLVAFEMTAGPTSGCEGMLWAELIPKVSYAANTTYRVRAVPIHRSSPSNELTFTFTTGDWSWAERVDHVPLEAKVSMLDGFPSDRASCTTGTVMSCATLNEFENVEVIARKDGEILLRWVLLANDPNFLFKVLPDCLEFRRREPTGARSQPLEICGDALNVRAYDASEVSEHGFYCRDGVVGVGPNVGRNPPAAAPAEDAGPGPDAGIDVDDSSAAGRGGRGGAGSQATSAPDTASEASGDSANKAEPRKYGCAALPGGHASSRPASGGLLLIVLVLARLRRRGRAAV
jgi:hypothetical protein